MNKPQEDEPLKHYLNTGEVGTVQTIPMDGDLMVGSSIEKPLMEIWVNMPDGQRYGISLIMTSSEFCRVSKDALYHNYISPVLEQLRNEYNHRHSQVCQEKICSICG